MTRATGIRTAIALACAALAMTLAACGGGGGGGGGGGTTPPPPPAAVTYTLELTGLTLTDRQTNDSVDPAGLPVAGAVASRNP